MTKTKEKEQVVKIDRHEFDIANYYKVRDRLLTLPSDQRARECGVWGYFSLFYVGTKGVKPEKSEWEEKVYQETAKYFDEHPEWGKPSFEVFQSMLNLSNDDKINPMISRIIQRVHDRELQDIEETKKYEKGKHTDEEYITKVEDEIDPSMIF